MPTSWTSRVSEREHLLGGGGIQRRRRLVEHEHAGRGAQHRADGHPLLLAARQGRAAGGSGARAARAGRGCPPPGGAWRSGAMPKFSMVYASSSSTVSVTKLDAGFWPTTPTRSASSRGGWSRVDRPSTRDFAREVAPREMGHQSVDGPEQRGLTRSRLPHHQAQFALFDGQLDAMERRPGSVGIGERDVGEPDHAGLPSATTALAGTTVGADDPRRGGQGHRGRGGHGRYEPDQDADHRQPGKSGAGAAGSRRAGVRGRRRYRPR